MDDQVILDAKEVVKIEEVMNLLFQAAEDADDLGVPRRIANGPRDVAYSIERWLRDTKQPSGDVVIR